MQIFSYIFLSLHDKMNPSMESQTITKKDGKNRLVYEALGKKIKWSSQDKDAYGQGII